MVQFLTVRALQQGTYLFMSGDALEGVAPHTYLDDLESFYYVMVYISLAYARPGCLKADPGIPWMGR